MKEHVSISISLEYQKIISTKRSYRQKMSSSSWGVYRIGQIGVKRRWEKRCIPLSFKETTDRINSKTHWSWSNAAMTPPLFRFDPQQSTGGNLLRIFRKSRSPFASLLPPSFFFRDFCFETHFYSINNAICRQCSGWSASADIIKSGSE